MTKKTIAVYPGTFDPVTNGHTDLVHRAAGLFDEIIVAVAENTAKTPLFTTAERVALVEQALTPRPANVIVCSFASLLVDFVRQRQSRLILRGLRAVSDFEYEFQLAAMNRKLAADIETIYLMPAEKYSFISSSLVKEIARLGGDVSGFVHPNVQAALRQKNSLK